MRRFGHHIPSSNVFRFIGISLFVLLATQMPLFNPSTWSFGQEDSSSTPDTEESLEEPADTESTDTEPDTPRPPSQSTKDEDIPQQTLIHMLWVSGWCGLFIFICSIVAVAFIVEHALTIRHGKVMPE